MMMTTLNVEEINKFYNYLQHEKETEIRVIDPNKPRPYNMLADIHVHNAAEFQKVCELWNGKGCIYAGLNERILGGRSNKDVQTIKHVNLDCDAVRYYVDGTKIPKKIKISSSVAELALVDKITLQIQNDFVQRGFKRPVRIMSGNGYQVGFTLPEIIVTDDNREQLNEKIKAFCGEIISKYSNGRTCEIDQIGDLARIVKVPGTLAVKGENTPERPHRTAYAVDDLSAAEPDAKLRDYILMLETAPQQETTSLPAKEITDAEFQKALAQDDKLARLYNGDISEFENDRSDAEQSLLTKLIILFGENKPRIFEIMNSSKIGKWKEDSDNYRERSYKNAVAWVKENATSDPLPGSFEKLISGFAKHGVPALHEIRLPHPGKLISEFAEELVVLIKDDHKVFFRSATRDIVEIGEKYADDEKNKKYTGFITVKPSRFITLAEKYCIPGSDVFIPKLNSCIFKEKSMSSEIANTVMMSAIFQDSLPRIDRIFTVPLPILVDGELTFPERGYDPRFNSWMPYDAPEISNPNMPLEEAKGLIDKIFSEFCFQSEQDRDNAKAALLTPFLRGLYSAFNVRTPLIAYLGNRERCGKDYCAGITGIVMEGSPLEEPPISTNAKQNNSDETRKLIMAAFLAGRKRFHTSNNKGDIDSAPFERALTARHYSDRILGKSEMADFFNEIDWSLSGNTGLSFTGDLKNRSIFVNLFLEIENANDRKFTQTDLHEFVKNNRDQVLSALYALVRHWIEQGSPVGTKSFASYPEWARICGGIMEAAGYLNPCISLTSSLATSIDRETADMKTLFEICYEKYSGQPVKKDKIKDIILTEDLDIFGYLNLTEHKDKIKFGNMLTRFTGRILSDIKMVVKDDTVRSPRQELIFEKILQQPSKTQVTENGSLGSHGSLDTTLTAEIKEKRTQGIEQTADTASTTNFVNNHTPAFKPEPVPRSDLAEALKNCPDIEPPKREVAA